MTQPNFRALCAELVNELHGYKALHPEHGTDLIDRACRELATTPPEQKSSIDDLIAGCKPLDPEMAEALTTEARWRLFGEDGSATPPPEAPTVMEALAARPLLEQVARLGDCIGANTVGKIIAISSRAAAWLEANPPGQPVTIEPRGCPTPGACSCVEPATPPPEPPADGEVAELVRWMRIVPQGILRQVEGKLRQQQEAQH